MAANPGARRSGSVDNRWALALSVTQDLMNALAASRIGEGLPVGRTTRRVTMPMMGELDVTLDLTILGLNIALSPEDGGRLRTTVRAAGDVSFGEGSPMPPLPGRPIVAAEVLVPVHAELRPDGRFVASVDPSRGEFVGMKLERIEGADIDPGTLEAMGGMLFASLGDDAFASMASGIDPIGVELPADQARPLVQLGVRPAPADIVVEDGVLTVGLPAHDDVEGHATAHLRPGQQISAGIASGTLTRLAYALAERTLGVPLPFDVELQPANSEVGARIRNRRLIETPWLPDLRPGVRTAVAARLAGDRIELSPREAWIELPLVPPVVNRINRAVGSLASLAPVSTSLPARYRVPVADGVTITLAVTELAMRPDGVTCVVDIQA